MQAASQNYWKTIGKVHSYFKDFSDIWFFPPYSHFFPHGRIPVPGAQKKIVHALMGAGGGGGGGVIIAIFVFWLTNSFEIRFNCSFFHFFIHGGSIISFPTHGVIQCYKVNTPNLSKFPLAPPPRQSIISKKNFYWSQFYFRSVLKRMLNYHVCKSVCPHWTQRKMVVAGSRRR